MNRTLANALVAVAVVGVGAGTWWMYQTSFGGPIAEANTRAEQLTSRVSELQSAIKKTSDSREQLKEVAASTLGPDAESVVHELRVALTEIGGTAGVDSLVVDSRASGELRSPAAKAFTESKKLRDSVDFGVVEGSIRGAATYKQAAEVIALIESQAWPKRIRSVTLEPGSKDDAGKLSLTLQLETLYIPGKSARKKDIDAPKLKPVSPERAELVTRIATHNLFTRPESAPKLAAAPMTAAPPPGVQWIVTGWELWIRSTRDQRTRSIRVGEKVESGTFVGVRDGYAVVDANGQRFAIGLGEPVEARERRIE